MSRIIRTLSLPEVETLVGWAAAEGWNPGLADAPAFHAADPRGFLGAFIEGEEMVAGISAVAYDESFGFIGLYICRPEFRGQGHGKAVWDAGMTRLGNRTIGLDGVPAQQGNYARMGFAKAYETIRMTGALPPADAAPVTAADVAALDCRCFPGPRRAFLEAWLSPPRIALGVAGGYGVVRQCIAGWKVGPLFAESDAIALHLIGALSAAAGGPVQIDIPERHWTFRVRLADAGFTSGFQTARMYRGPAPQIALDAVYGTTSLELG